MFVNEEKVLVKKGYISQKDGTTIFNYTKGMKEVVVSYYPFKQKNNYKFSFPVSHDKQYACYFSEEKKLREYVKYIVNFHL